MVFSKTFAMIWADMESASTEQQLICPKYGVLFWVQIVIK